MAWGGPLVWGPPWARGPPRVWGHGHQVSKTNTITKANTLKMSHGSNDQMGKENLLKEFSSCKPAALPPVKKYTYFEPFHVCSCLILNLCGCASPRPSWAPSSSCCSRRRRRSRTTSECSFPDIDPGTQLSDRNIFLHFSAKTRQVSADIAHEGAKVVDIVLAQDLVVAARKVQLKG